MSEGVPCATSVGGRGGGGSDSLSAKRGARPGRGCGGGDAPRTRTPAWRLARPPPPSLHRLRPRLASSPQAHLSGLRFRVLDLPHLRPRLAGRDRSAAMSRSRRALAALGEGVRRRLGMGAPCPGSSRRRRGAGYRDGRAAAEIVNHDTEWAATFASSDSSRLTEGGAFLRNYSTPARACSMTMYEPSPNNHRCEPSVPRVPPRAFATLSICAI